MNVLLITYDISDEIRRLHIVRKFETDPTTYVRLSESSYAMKTDRTAQDVYDHFNGNYIRQGDQLCVITLTRPCVGASTAKVDNWLNQYLP